MDGAMLDADDDAGSIGIDAGAGVAEEEAALQLAQEYPVVGAVLCCAACSSGHASLLSFSLCASQTKPACSQW